MATTTVNTLYTVSNIGVLGSTGISLGLPADATYFCTPNCYAVNNFIFIKAYRNNGTTRDYYTKVLSLDGTILHSNSYNVNTSVALTEYGFLYSPKYPTYFLVQYYGATNKTDSIKLIGTNVPLVVNTISSLTPFSGRSDFMDNKFMVYGGIYKYIPEYLREIGIAQNNHVLNDTVKTRLLLEGDIDKSDLSNFIGKLTKSTSGTSQYLTKGISATDRIILKSFYNITY